MPPGDRIPVTGRKNWPSSINVAQRRAQALEMRRAGATYTQIRERLGYKTNGAVSADLTAALTMLIKQPAEEVRALELARLDGLMVTLWPMARRGDLAAVDRVLKVMERRSKLLGLDAPQRHEMVTLDAVEAEIRRLEAELGQKPASENTTIE